MGQSKALLRRRCFSPFRLSLPLSYFSSPELWWRPRTCQRNVALRRWWEMSPTPCCLVPFMESFPASASMVASTLSLALPAQSFALKRVIYHLGAFLTYQVLLEYLGNPIGTLTTVRTIASEVNIALHGRFI